MNWDGRIIYTRWLGEDFCRVVLRRSWVREIRGIRRVIH